MLRVRLLTPKQVMRFHFFLIDVDHVNVELNFAQVMEHQYVYTIQQNVESMTQIGSLAMSRVRLFQFIEIVEVCTSLDGLNYVFSFESNKVKDALQD